VLFSEPKIPQFQMFEMTPPAQRVSVLFSEPKIPQWGKSHLLARMLVGFSALQRAENSSIVTAALMFHIRRGFSALQRAENSSMEKEERSVGYDNMCFSALQRAENSSINQTGGLSCT